MATLAWNTTRHVETWYGIAGCGAVCHTVNPRLFEKDIEFIIQDAEDMVLLVDITFFDLVSRLKPCIPSVKHVILLTDEKHMPSMAGNLEALCYETEIAKEYVDRETFKWHPSNERDACGMCYTSGTTGKPKGVLYGHRSNFLHAMAMCFPDGLDLDARSSFLMVVVSTLFHTSYILY